MRSQRLVLALFSAVILGSGLLAAIGLRSLAIDAERVDARYREQATAALTVVRGALNGVLEDVRKAAAPAITVRIAPDGALLEPVSKDATPGERSARSDALVPNTAEDRARSAQDTSPNPTPSGPRDRVLLQSLSDEVDMLEREGQDATARARLREAAAREDDPWFAAWALSALAAIEKRAGEFDAAQESWRTLASRFAGIPDDRGLDRAFAARYELVLSGLSADAQSAAADGVRARSSTDTIETLLRLYSDMIEASALVESPALAAQKSRVAALSRTEIDVGTLNAARADLRARFDDLALRDHRIELASAIVDAYPRTIAPWIAEHPESGARAFKLGPALLDSPSAPPRRALVAWTRAADGNVAGGALEIERCAELALARPEISAYATVGIATAITREDGRKLATAGAGERELASEPLVEQRGVAPFESLRMAAFGLDRAGFLARERQRFVLVAVLSLLALAVACVAGFATLRAVKREVEAARGREDFVAAVTHELKAPLASIRLLAEVLGRGGVEEDKVREFAARTVTETERLTRLVDSVLEWARIEHSSESKRDRVDLNAIAARALETFRPLARERGFDVELRAASEALIVGGDADALEGALLNLLDNALKYSDRPHTIEIEVARVDCNAHDERDTPSPIAATRVTSRAARDVHLVAEANPDSSRRARNRAVEIHAVLSVLDRGRGVPAASAPHIFEPFRRVGDELVRDRPGVGLGLALVHKVALAHGGKATYIAREGGGSRFAIELPLVEDAT